jgi:hypothetical protein
MDVKIIFELLISNITTTTVMIVMIMKLGWKYIVETLIRVTEGRKLKK